MTFMFDPAEGLMRLKAFEEQWGGNAQERLAAKYAAYAAERGEFVSPAPRRDEEIFDQVEAEARAAATQAEEIANEAVTPRAEANPAATPVPSQTPLPSPSPAPSSDPSSVGQVSTGAGE